MLDRRTRFYRRLLRALGWLLLRLFTRTTVEGREYLRTPGPVLFAGNHTSTFDAVLLMLLLPPDAIFVGPGDFKLLWPGDWFVRHLGVILMKRGAVDRDNLKRLMDLLEAGGALGIFPEGGTWEKPIDDVKPGAAYLSSATGARIVPMGFSGTYQVWRRIALLRRPRMVVRIAAPLPPVTIADRKRRQEELQTASVALMRTIYALLTPQTQAHYDRQARLSFSGQIVFAPDGFTPPPALAGADFSALAELIAKPNLFSPLVYNARLPVRPFVRAGRAVPARDLRRAAQALRAAFSAGDFASYLEYRLGDHKANAVRQALTAIDDGLSDAEARGVRAAFAVQVMEVPTRAN